MNLLAAHKTTGQERDIWKSKVRADLKTNILSFMDGHSDSIDTAVAENKRRSHMIAKFQKVVDDTAKRYGVEPGQIITVPLLNYAAPSLVKADARTGHVNTLQYILNHNTNNIALLLRPCHAYKKVKSGCQSKHWSRCLQASAMWINPLPCSLMVSATSEMRGQ